MKSSSDTQSVVGMIPARYAATRLPGKVLADIGGKPMVQHVYERASQAEVIQDVIVATDDSRVFEAVEAFGGTVVMTSSEHRSGTDRLAEVARGMDCDIVVNIQGDEPLIDADAIDAAVEPLLGDASIAMSTLRSPITDREEYENPAAVQVVVDREGFALYFSRAPIPYFRIDDPDAIPESGIFAHPVTGLAAYRHIGMYVYRRETLLWLSELEPTPLEKTENLEQLRALENGCRIKVVEYDYSPIGVDTPEQLVQVRRIIAEAQGGAD